MQLNSKLLYHTFGTSILFYFNRSAFKDPSKSSVPAERAFDVPTYVLKHTMNGQDWPGGTAEYHSHIRCPTLLIHGEHDSLVTVEEEEEMEQVTTANNCMIWTVVSGLI